MVDILIILLINIPALRYFNYKKIDILNPRGFSINYLFNTWYLVIENDIKCLNENQ